VLGFDREEPGRREKVSYVPLRTNEEAVQGGKLGRRRGDRGVHEQRFDSERKGDMEGSTVLDRRVLEK